MPTVKQQDILNRLASACGHLAAVREMTARGEPCQHVILQLRAVQGALNKIEQRLTEQHLHRCLSCPDKSAIELETEIFDLLFGRMSSGSQPRT